MKLGNWFRLALRGLPERKSARQLVLVGVTATLQAEVSKAQTCFIYEEKLSLIEYGGWERQVRGRNKRGFEAEFLLNIDLYQQQKDWELFTSSKTWQLFPDFKFSCG